MQKWIKIIEINDIKENKEYFIGRKKENNCVGDLFWSRPLRGKDQWTTKPGIAIRYKGCEDLKEVLRKNPNAVAIEVPLNACTRWRARKANFNKK